MPPPNGPPGSQTLTVAWTQAAGRPGVGPGVLGSDADVRQLLHRRLRVLAVITLGFWTAFWLGKFPRVELTPRNLALNFVPGGVFLALLLAFAITLWRSRQPPLRRLRAIELAFFAAVAGYFGWDSYRGLYLDTWLGPDGQAWLGLFAARGPNDLTVLARHAGWTAVAPILAYGVFIPNTGRRSAVVLTAMAGWFYGLVLVGAVLHPVPGGLPLAFFAELAIMLGVGVCLAVFGATRIHALQQQADAARRLGQYQLGGLLGQGGMGEVYLAEHLLLKRPCAVKLIRPERTGDRRDLARFEREVKATAALTHPNTVQVYDYGRADDGTFYYVMEYLPGQTLEQLVGREGPLPAGRVVHLLRQLCGALGEAHAAGLIHRDVKPANVIVCDRGGVADTAKLLDFGIVDAPGLTDAERRTAGGWVPGTPAYMSPEQAAGRADLDARSDLYSLGAVAYFLLAGRPPFVKSSIAATVRAQIGDPPPPLGYHRMDLPGELAEAVMKCLAKDPADRFPTAAALDQALAACRVGPPAPLAAAPPARTRADAGRWDGYSM